LKVTVEEVQQHVRLQAENDLGCTNDHRLTLKEVLVAPQKISITIRTVQKGRAKDQNEEVWLVGQEDSGDGYKIVMREDGSQFGLASKGFPSDKYLVLAGWYGGLKSAFLSM
jgi:hypothetical protein